VADNSEIVLQQILQLQELVIADRKETNDHLTKLRENVHTLANDYHGVAAISQMQREQILEIKQKQASVEKTLEDRLERGFKDIRDDIDAIDIKVQKMAPSANAVSAIGDAILKWSIPFILSAILASTAIYKGAFGG